MRVIAGYLGSRTFTSPRTQRTHPMSDRMRGGLFATLGDIKGLNVLDTFAGSGALAIEAISRGAKFAQTIEVDKQAHSIITSNIKELGLEDKIKATKAYYSAWSKRNRRALFDLVLADPPWDNMPYRDIDELPKQLKPSGTLVLSWPGKIKPPDFAGLKQVHAKNYGDGQLVFYKKIS